MIQRIQRLLLAITEAIRVAVARPTCNLFMADWGVKLPSIQNADFIHRPHAATEWNLDRVTKARIIEKH